MAFTVSVRDLRYRFPEIEKRLKRGETVEIRRHQKLVARLIPAEPPAQWPDFRALRHELWGKKVMKLSTTELLRERAPSTCCM